jgi:glutamine---fructose-6-phosphate transaminase (isomerizing)
MSDREPELRSGPPWVMEEMIHAELGLPARISAEPAVSLVAERVGEAASAGESIVICGCGTSEHAARAIQASLEEAAPACRAVARDSFEVRLDPPDRGLLIAVSHAAGTAATRDAATGAVSRGARALLITACPEDAPEAVQAAATPLYDASWCHTVAYLSPILTCALGANLAAATARELIDCELANRQQRRADAVALARSERLLIIGSGVDEITASELALKIEEAAHVPCTPLGTEKVLHGHLPAADARTGAVLIRFDPSRATQRDERTADVAAAAGVLAMPTVTLARPALASGTEALIAGAVALQLLTLELSMARGTNPDLIRREQPLYRRVAELGRAG